MYKTYRLKKDLNIQYKDDVENFIDVETITIKVKDPIVKINQNVFKGTPLDNQDYPTYSPVSGTIESISNNQITIKNNFMELYENPKKISKKKSYDKYEIIAKLKANSFKDLDILIGLNNNNQQIVINGIDDIPYVINNQKYLINNYEQILEISEILYETFKPVKFYMTFKNTYNEIIEKYNNSVGSHPFINFKYLNDEYPLSYKEILCNKLSLNKDETIVINIDQLVEMYYIIKCNKPLAEKYITIITDEEESFVLNTKLGTSINSIINKYNLKIENKDIYINNLLQRKITSKSTIIDRNTIAIYILTDRDLEPDKCIKCGTCNRVCPFGLNPLNTQDLKQCRSCGLCTYNCPSKIILGRSK